MDLKRFFVSGEITDTVKLVGSEFIHATKVCRFKPGIKFIACCNSDKDYYCTVTSIAKDFLLGKVDKVLTNETYSDVNFTLYIGVCKGLDDVIQKAVEMGVTKVVPFTSQHTNVSNINKERLNKIILESSKQSGRSILMELGDVVTFGEALKKSTSSKKRILFYEFERKAKVSSCLNSTNNDIALFIGSEGGFSLEEISLATETNVSILTLGRRILRVETAVVAALALCQQAVGTI